MRIHTLHSGMVPAIRAVAELAFRWRKHHPKKQSPGTEEMKPDRFVRVDEIGSGNDEWQLMGLWKIVPVERWDSPQWLDHQIWREVVVRASTAAKARLLAAEMERDQVPHRVPVDNENPSFQSGLSDEKLYWVSPLSPDEHPSLDRDGEDGIVRVVRDADGES